MDITALSAKYGGFYAPGFNVMVDNSSLIDQLAIPVSQVEVDLKLGAAGRFSFAVVNSYDLEQHDFISGYLQPVVQVVRFGAPVSIGVGYGDHSKLATVISGVITEVTTSFSESGMPELTVAGYDNLFPLTLGKRSRSWKKKTDSDVVALIAKEYNLSASIQTTTEQHAQIEQNQESDLEFIKKLADRNYFQFYIDANNTLCFGPPSDTKDGIVELAWGAGLLSFRPEANLAAQVSAVEVYGWDSDRKRAIVGKAVAGQESGKDPKRTSGGAQVRAALNRDIVLQVRQPVFTVAEANRRAQAVLDEHAKTFLTGEAECIGLPDLRPDTNINLGNLGVPFSKTYYVQETTHKVDTGGYRTVFKVQETSL
jgi:phage protein D